MPAGMELQGNVTVNGVPHCESNHKQGYVQQEDLFYSQLTVRYVNIPAQLMMGRVIVVVNIYEDTNVFTVGASAGRH